MGIVDRLLGRQQSATGTESLTGMVRVGGTSYSARWSFARTLDSVYANPTARRCIERIAHDFQRPNWQLRAPGTTEDVDPADERYNLLRRPNRWTSGTSMQYHISRDLDICGGTTWLKLRGAEDDGFGDRGPVTGLRRLAPQRITVIADDDDELLGFVYSDRLGRNAVLRPEEVVYCNYPHPERPSDRMAPALVAGLPAETDTAAMRFNFELLSNDSALPGYLVVEGLSPKQFDEWASAWTAGEQPGKTRFVGGNNAKYVKVGQTNQELTYSQLREASREDICRAFGPPRVLIDPTDATFSNMDVAQRTYMMAVVLPRWTMVADAFTMQLGPELGGAEIGFNLDDIDELQEGLDSLVDRAVKLLDKGVVTVNDVRKDLGLDPVPWGDVPLTQLGAQNSPTPPPQEPPPARSVVIDTRSIEADLLELETGTKAAKSPDVPGFDRHVNRAEGRAERAMKRFFERQGKAIEKRIEGKKGRTKALDDWWDGDRWNSELTELWAPMLGDTVDAIGSAALGAFVTDADLDATSAEVSAYLDNRSQAIANLVNSTTEEEVRAVIASGVNAGDSIPDIARSVRDYFTESKVMRSERVARTEIIGAANFGAIEGARQSGIVTGKTWLAASTAEEHCLSMSGTTVGLDESFGEVDQPPLHPNCRCTVTFVVDEATQ